jgi:hypothetical protein
VIRDVGPFAGRLEHAVAGHARLLSNVANSQHGPASSHVELAQIGTSDPLTVLALPVEATKNCA